MRVINPSASSRLSIGDSVAESSWRDVAISLTDNGRPFVVAAVVIPQRQHDEILRMGECERLQQRPVHREHGAVGDGQREAHLALEGQRVDLFVDDGHDKIVPY